MKEPLTKYIDPGIIHFMIYPETMSGTGPVYETLKNIVTDDFFNAVEITHIEEDEEREKVKKILASSHMQVYYGAQPRLLSSDSDLNSFDSESRKKAVNIIKDSIDEAVKLGAQAVIFKQKKCGKG